MNNRTLLLAAGLLSAAVARADWQLVTDWQNDTVVNLNKWVQLQGPPPVGDFYLEGIDQVDANNKTLYMDAGQRGVQCNVCRVAYPLTGGGVAEGATATLKFDFYHYGTSYDMNLGFTDVPTVIDPATGFMTAPIAWADFEAQIRMGPTFTVRDAGNFRDTGIAIPVGQWITIYLVIDNAADTVEGYFKVKGSDTLTPILVPTGTGTETKTTWIFRNGTTNPMVSFYIGSSNSCDRGYDNGDIWMVDNIQVDYAGKNLDQGASWAGFPVDGSGNVWTDTWMGAVNVAQAPWIFVYSLNQWIYIPEDFISEAGAWGYINR